MIPKLEIYLKNSVYKQPINFAIKLPHNQVSYCIHKSDCIYHFPIDLDQNQSENGKNNQISVRFNKIFLCVVN